MERWEIEVKLDRIMVNNIKEIPYEGLDVDFSGLKLDIMQLINEL
jgi:hypothetical protein